MNGKLLFALAVCLLGVTSSHPLLQKPLDMDCHKQDGSVGDCSVVVDSEGLVTVHIRSDNDITVWIVQGNDSGGPPMKATTQ